MSTHKNDRHTELELAFGKLKVIAGREPHFRGAVEQLSSVDTAGSGTMLQKYRPAESKGGRPANVRAFAVSAITANTYYLLTGRKPTLIVSPYVDDSTPTGPFFELIREVFRILELAESPEHFAKSISRSYKLPGAVKKVRKQRFPPLYKREK